MGVRWVGGWVGGVDNHLQQRRQLLQVVEDADDPQRVRRLEHVCEPQLAKRDLPVAQREKVRRLPARQRVGRVELLQLGLGAQRVELRGDHERDRLQRQLLDVHLHRALRGVGGTTASARRDGVVDQPVQRAEDVLYRVGDASCVLLEQRRETEQTRHEVLLELHRYRLQLDVETLPHQREREGGGEGVQPRSGRQGEKGMSERLLDEG